MDIDLIYVCVTLTMQLLVRWWASYPPDLLNERLIQPMQAFITKELAAVKKLTSSIMAVIKVLARVEAANQLAGGPLPPECFYNTLIRYGLTHKHTGPVTQLSAWVSCQYL